MPRSAGISIVSSRMVFFGDRERDEEPREVIAELAKDLAGAAALPGGPRRHGAVAACLVRAGELAQGLADAAEPEGRGEDAARAAMRATTRLARGTWRSWRTGGVARAPSAAALEPLAGRDLPRSVRLRRPEGYCLYALYPETYAVAARALAPARDLTVIGIRTIGTSLAAMVAAGAGAARVPLTVRPSGHPFARRLEVSAAFAEAVGPAAVRAFAVVDEGPGLSGSSLAAVAEALLSLGADPARIHLFTSHPHAPGAEASARVRELLARLPRHFTALEDVLLAPGPLSVTSLAEDVIGPSRIEDDLTGGRWRAWLFGAERDWPPSEGWLERRKLMLVGPGEARHVARFAALGEQGERKLSRARALAGAGVGIPPAALRHGFLFEPWLGASGARPLTVAQVSRPALLDAIHRVVRVSAARPRPRADGAPPSELAVMARVNAGEALGLDAGELARRVEDLVGDVEREARPVEVDGKMQRWEWLALPGGRVVKTDAVDHHAAHDLAGCQDALWDVAGAQVELGLTDREAIALVERVRADAPGAGPALLPFYRLCLLALEVGRWSYAVASEPPGPERARRDSALERYRRALGGELAALARARRRAHPAGAPAGGGGAWRGSTAKRSPAR